MKKQNKGKFLKQSQDHGRMGTIAAVFVILVVFGISSFAFYKAGQRSAAGLQETEPHSSIKIQEYIVETQQAVANETVAIIAGTAIETKETTAPHIIIEPPKITEPAEYIQPTTEAVISTECTGAVRRSVDALNVRSGAGVGYDIISRLNGGEAVTVYEQVTVDGMTWGNIGYGWVSMDYIVFGVDNSVEPSYRKEDYFGDWLSSDKKCHMSITQNGSGADIQVTHTIAENVDMTWAMYGEFDEHGAIRYWNGVRKDHNLGIESLKYTYGEGAIVMDGLGLSWHESAEGPGEAGRFEKIFNYRPNNSGGTVNSPNQGSNSAPETAEIPRRFGSDEIKKVLINAAKIELGYRHGDEFSMETPIVIGYKSSTGKYSVWARGRWCGSNYYINAVLQDVNGILTVSSVLNFDIK